MSVLRLRPYWLPRICFLLALMPAASAQDADTASTALYDVELVIFRPLSPSSSAEEWLAAATAAPVNPGEDSGNTLDGTIDLPVEDGAWPEQAAGTSEAGPAVVAIEPVERRLETIYGTLRRSAQYRPLAHLGWLQEAVGLGRGAPLDLSPLLEPGAPLRASATLERGRYLHLTLELVLESPDDGQRYTIRQTRRMRSGERHYFDHPLFGAIALITPHRSEPALDQRAVP